MPSDHWIHQVAILHSVPMASLVRHRSFEVKVTCDAFHPVVALCEKALSDVGHEARPLGVRLDCSRRLKVLELALGEALLSLEGRLQW